MICSFLGRGIAFICASQIRALERVRPSIRLRGHPILLLSRGRTVLKGDESILSHADGVIEGSAVPERERNSWISFLRVFGANEKRQE